MAVTNKKKTTIDDKRVTRCYNFEIRASKDENERGIIEGMPIVCDSKTDLGYFDEIISRGALKNTDLKDVRFLVNHNLDMIPLARSRNNNVNSTMQLTPSDDGLKIRVKLDIENNSEARNLYSAIDRGDITGMSFMFSIRAEEWEGEETDHPTRTITDIEKVFEVSAVTFPAYEDTEINARCKAELDSYRATLESMRSNTPDGASVDYKRNNANNGNNGDDGEKLELLKLKNKILGGL